MLPITILFLPEDRTAAEALRWSLHGIEVSGIQWSCDILSIPGGNFLGLNRAGDVQWAAGTQSGLVGFTIFMPGINKQGRKTFADCQRRFERDGRAFVHWFHLALKGPLELWMREVKQELRTAARKQRRAIEKARVE